MVNRRVIALVLCLATGLALGSCASSPGQADNGSTSNPWSSEIQRIRARTDNELVRRILEDGKITDAEIQEFMDSYNTCLAKYDLSTTYDRENQYETMTDQFSQYSADQMTQYNEECRQSVGYYDLIPLDENMHSNPRNLSNDDALRTIYECRKRHHLVDANMSFAEYRNTFREQSNDDGNPLANGPFAKYYAQNADESDTDVRQWFACEMQADS